MRCSPFERYEERDKVDIRLTYKNTHLSPEIKPLSRMAFVSTPEQYTEPDRGVTSSHNTL